VIGYTGSIKDGESGAETLCLADARCPDQRARLAYNSVDTGVSKAVFGCLALHPHDFYGKNVADQEPLV
jgi:hypothetical protein